MMAVLAAATIMIDGQKPPLKTTDSVNIQCAAHSYVVTTVADYKHPLTVTVTKDGADALAPVELAKISAVLGAYKVAGVVFVECEPEAGLDVSFALKGPLDRHSEDVKLLTASWMADGVVKIRAERSY